MAEPCGFQVVKRKGKSKSAGRKAAKTTADDKYEDESFDLSRFQKRLRDYMQELRLTDFMQDCTGYLASVVASQAESQCTDRLDPGQVKDNGPQQTDRLDTCCHLLSYGIGRFISCPIARYQLAFLLVLRQKLKSPPCHVYDPVFSPGEMEVLEEEGCTLISHNEEGKRVCDTPTILFMPHCGKALYNNVIWANWTTLSNLVIIGNSFSRMIESTPHRLLQQTAKYVIKVSPYMTERPLHLSSFAHSDVFNDLSVHTFPRSKLKMAPEGFWEDKEEPVYDQEEVEIIRREDCGNGD